MFKKALFALVLSAMFLGAGSMAFAGGDGKCNLDSDYGGGGAKCNRGKCSNAPDGTCHFDSQYAGAGRCGAGSKCKKQPRPGTI